MSYAEEMMLRSESGSFKPREILAPLLHLLLQPQLSFLFDVVGFPESIYSLLLF
jgi:hypothetical protein